MIALIRAQLGLLVLVTCSTSALASEMRAGTTMTVKSNSIWFQDVGQLTHWQKLRKGRKAAALAAYQEQKLRSRDAWQFIYPMEVKVLGHTPKTNPVSMEMLTEGRMLDTKWVLDAGTLMQKRAAQP